MFLFRCQYSPCGEAFYFTETIQLIRGACQVSGFCMLWVFTVKNIQARHRFCCFNVNKLSCYVIVRKSSCAADLLVPYLDAGWYQLVEGEIGSFINRIASNLFFCSCDARISFKNLLTALIFLLIILFSILLRKCSLMCITICVKVRFGSSRQAISWLFHMFILIYYLIWFSSLILLSGESSS